MMMNPELRRNIWLELSLQRLMAMPVILGLIFWLVLLNGDATTLAKFSVFAFQLIVFFWGTRRAALAVATELNANTWDDQRMSPVSAWSMSWGKILGSTAYVWYGGALCLIAFTLASITQKNFNFVDITSAILPLAVALVMMGLLGQTVSIAASLAFMRKQRSRRRVPVSMCQLLGLIAIYGTSSHAFSELFVSVGVYGGASVLPPFVWFGSAQAFWPFVLISMAAFLGWALLGAHRLMQLELQYRTRPWAWAAFTVFLMIYATGFLYERLASSGAGMFVWLVVPFLIAGIGVYGAFFLEPKNIVILRKLIAAVQKRNWSLIWGLSPVWLISLALLWGVGASLIVAILGSDATAPDAMRWFGVSVSQISSIYVVAWLLFVARDIFFLLWLNLSNTKGRPDMAGFVYLLILYGVLPSLLVFSSGTTLLPVVVPYPSDNLLTAILPVALQVMVLAVLCWRGWARNSPRDTVVEGEKV
jgi:hypothetical protein